MTKRTCFVQEGSYQAQSNLKFLSVLKEPCRDLSEAEPRDVAPLLPGIVSLIRMIWANSEFYNTRERLTAIFRKVAQTHTYTHTYTHTHTHKCLLWPKHNKPICAQAYSTSQTTRLGGRTRDGSWYPRGLTPDLGKAPIRRTWTPATTQVLY